MGNYKLHVKKGDNVMVISGNSKGKQGKVLFVDGKKKTAIVEGVNMATKHAKPDAKNPQGGIISKEAPMNLSNIMVIDGTGKATRVGRRVNEKTGKIVRYSKKSGEVIK